MAFSNDQIEPNMPAGSSNNRRKSVDFLPRYFRTSTNQKFLGATVDQLISEGEVDKVNAYIGRRNTKSRTSSDRYLEDVSPEREAYQLEPSLVLKDSLDNIVFFKDYNDYINQIKFFNNEALDHSKLNSQEFYTWNPHIDWDKFVNYREYYWLPQGPTPISITGQSTAIVTTYSVNLVQEDDNEALIFNAISTKDGAIVIKEGLVRNPSLKLYRGQTYKFEINSPSQPITIKTARDTSDANIYRDGVIKSSDANGENVLATDWVSSGYITFQVPLNAPNTLYYVSQNDINSSGIFKVYDITEASSIDVEAEILGKKTYRTSSQINLSNGMKVNFQGKVTPEKYATGYWFVEGVGNSIYLISETDLETPAIFTTTEDVEFDNEKFDSQGFDVNNNVPATKDYITINRGSKDRNAWSRYNRWFHRSVIEASAAANNLTFDIDQSTRGTRPIIEFVPGLQLINHGKQAKKNVQLVDTYTKDVFSTIEGSLGYNIDGVDLVEGMRILFTADTDPRVNGRIFKVGKVLHLSVNRLTLLPEDDTDPIEGETVLVLQGRENRGQMFYYADGQWNLAQNKTSINQTPLFDVFNSSGVSFADKNTYIGSTFNGTKLFSYRPGTTLDPELNFNIAYKNIGNIGDILFDFNLHTDTVSYQVGSTIKTEVLDIGYLQINDGLRSTKTVNGWVTAAFESKQPVIRIYEVSSRFNFFEIDVYDKSGNLTDLKVNAYVNNVKQSETDFTIYKQSETAYVRFYQDLVAGDILVIETESAAKKNDNGYYKFPINLEKNPQNLSLKDFTLGEIFNHVQTIASNLAEFTGQSIGSNNLRDLGPVSNYGTKIVQHSAPLMPVAYHITDKKFNIIRALRKSREEYSKFKRNLIRTATDYGYDGNTSTHLDLILRAVTKDKIKESPYYLSDMVPFGANFVLNQPVLDDAITEYPLTFDFNLESPSEKAVFVYLNDKILVHGSDYIFVNTNFVRILTPIVAGDDLKIVQYSATDGCCVPPTPTKLGLYPAFEPAIYVDNTYQTPTKVIQGHDGSITVAFNDYRDDLLLEFETRIFNNIKVKYDTSLFDLHDYISGFSRTSEIERAELNSVLRQEFLKWVNLIGKDYTKHDFFDNDRINQFTFNYSDFADPSGAQSLGFWRGIFKYFYDTDRPHTHPWEMLGFSIKPSWWETVYGPAPYTSDNLILWGDLEQGIIRDPSKTLLVRKEYYARPGLLSRIPVDELGNLKSPITAGLVINYVSTSTNKEFVFGDQSPVETAWRRNSEFPFALITALTLLRPSKVFATCFDRVRQYRDSTGQLVYKTDRGNLRFNCKDLITPNTVSDQTRVFTSGLVNYMVDYAISLSASAVEEYKTNLNSLQVKMASKLGGFTSKEKFRLILDSRTPLNEGNVFIPEENYSIILNTSSPVLSINYSGVIVEKQPSGFIVKGYNKPVPEFNYFKHKVTLSDPVVNIGGISETYVDWSDEKYYGKGVIVRYDQNYFRVTTAHTSTSVFEVKYFAKLPSLPVTGGREIILRKNFETTISKLHYGTELKTVQDVVDFLLGYGEFLKATGFNFEYFNPVLKTVTDWQTAAREFVFWTTQNWAAGAVISLSPGADELKFIRDYAVVDNIYDNFYEYTVLKEDGNILESSFTSSTRLGNEFSLVPKNTAAGIYHASLNLVQKEHVLILDDVTVFNDIIYDQIQGYHQERIKVLGYRTSNWHGDFNIPGFVYDRALVSEWTPWHDYALGETVKYKEFYYSAKNNIPGAETFDFQDWYRLAKKPESQLLPNWDYRANQFPDFYDLDSDSFDVSQQQFAQHLIGYQKRKYLENIINDDVAQYKFYQGMIREKGSQNSLSKLFDALNTADKDSLEFYEEWAIRLGQYGASDGFEEVEYILDESKFFLNPQPVELVQAIDPLANDYVYRITPDQAYLKPENYNHAPFPVSATRDFLTTAGYVNKDDVDYIVNTKEEFANYAITAVREGTYFWVVEDKNSWNVYRFSLFTDHIRSISAIGADIVIELEDNKDDDIVVGEFIGIYNAPTGLDGIYKVVDTTWNSISITTPETFDTTLLDQFIDAIRVNINLYKFTPRRIDNIDNISSLYPLKKKRNELAWVDNSLSDWKVWKFNKVFNYIPRTANLAGFGTAIAVNDENNIMAISMVDRVFYYTRFDSNFNWVQNEILTPNLPIYLFNLISNYENFNIRETQTISEITFTVNGVATAEPAGVTIGGKTLRINPFDPAYANLAVDEVVEIGISYVITNNLSETYQQVETVTITGPAESPTVSSNLARKSIATNNSFGWNMTMDHRGDYLFVSAPAYADLSFSNSTGAVAFYKKNRYDDYIISNVFLPQYNITDIGFGWKTALFSPAASNWEPGQDYQIGDIISFNGIKYRATKDHLSTSGDIVNETLNMGNWIVFAGILIVASKGNNSVNSSITIIDVSSNQTIARQEIPGELIVDLGLSDDGVLVVSTNAEKVYVYRLSLSSIGTQVVTLTTENQQSRFGTSVAITRDGTTIAVGSPQYEGLNPNQGLVSLYKLAANTYVFDYNITSPVSIESEEFGTGLKFNIAGDQLVVYSQGGSQSSETIFDNRQTIFDLGNTTFSDREEYVGIVRVFDRYNTKFVFSDDLEVTYPAPVGIYFGSNLIVTDRIYVNDPAVAAGAVYEFYSPTKSWTTHNVPSLPVDLDKIKSIFLYDTEKSNIIAYLDYVDPIKGKILGIAEQELSFKTFYDPAVYSIGVESVVVDPLMSWQSSNVGKLWWDLSTAKFVYPYQGSALFKANTWNTLFESNSIDIYEWVESEYLPSEWDALADTEEGLTLGISGLSKYGDNCYATSQRYDNVSKTFKNIYYFWAKNKNTVPDVDFRKLSAKDVSQYISDPKSKGVKFATLLGSNQFALVNCKELITDKNVAINIRYWTIKNKEINIHAHYQLIAAGDTKKTLNQYVEKKWFDSLIGYDSLGNEVPDPRLPAKIRYGILSKPRQGMFINRIEALKQFIERVNSVLVNKLIVDDFNLSALYTTDPAPTAASGQYDTAIDTYAELRFVGLTGVRTAQLEPVIINGKIKSVNIIDSGRAYGLLNSVPDANNLWYGPAIDISSTGDGAKLTSIVNKNGEIVEVRVDREGSNYPSATFLSVRPFTVLVKADENINGKWALYTYRSNNHTWFRTRAQIFNTRNYWDFVNWYATGYTQFTKVDHEVNFVYELPSKDILVGETVRVKFSGQQGWILFEKIDDQATLETTVNYKVIARENGTIQFKSTLYKFASNNLGFDGPTFDNDLYDNQPKQELRIILDTIKDVLFVDELEAEYNNLFFASLRYAFSEQPFIDWAFKTSFVKSVHNLGELEQPSTYQTDTLSSYEDYISEVKPYRTKIREFVSNFDRIERTRSQVSDFDLPARYDAESRTFKAFAVSVSDYGINYDSAEILKSPYTDWYDNVGHSVVEILVVDGGAGYKSAPEVNIVGFSRDAAEATAYISNGSVSKIIVTVSGSGYLVTPKVIINGAITDTGRPAKAVAILGNSLIRNLKVNLKFDRILSAPQISNLNATQTFENVAPRAKFVLNWPADLTTNKITVTVNNEEILHSDFDVYNENTLVDGFTLSRGVVEFYNPDALPTISTIVISYIKGIEAFTAADRIQHYYTALPGQVGKDFGQLMDGVDYGGVDITGVNFNVRAGWDVLPWFTTSWDSYDPTYTDYVVKSNTSFFVGSIDSTVLTVTEVLGYRPEIGTTILGNNVLPNTVIKSVGEVDADGVGTYVVSKSQEVASGEMRAVDLSYTLPYAPADGEVINVYLNGNRIDEPNYGAEGVVNAPNTYLESFVGDGSTAAIFLPAAAPWSSPVVDLNAPELKFATNTLIFRKSTSDGSQIPLENIYDIELSGGNLAYSTARGIKPSEIIVDGDGLITPMTSHAPEEVVPGHVADSMVIGVFCKTPDGNSIIVSRHYTATNGQVTYGIGQQPANESAVFVKVGGLLKSVGVDYTIDYSNETITLTTAPADTTEVVVSSLNNSGTSVADIDKFVGDGSTTEFVAPVAWQDTYTALVTVNGITTTVTLFKTSSSYLMPNSVGFSFETAPADGAIINYIIVNGSADKINLVQSQKIVTDGSSLAYPLSISVGQDQPKEVGSIVEINGKVLRPSDFIYFDVAGTSRTYTVSETEYPLNSINLTEINVYKSGTLLTPVVNYTWNSATNELKIKRGVAVTGDIIVLEIYRDNEYSIHTFNGETQLELTANYAAGTEVTVTMFTNVQTKNIERTLNVVRTANGFQEGTTDFYKFTQLTSGRFKLSRPALAAKYVWVSLNDTLLTPNIDYILEESKEYIRLDSNIKLVDSDVVDIIVFGSGSVSRTPFGYKIFKDILNRVTYNRIDDSGTTTLAQPLNFFDEEIFVVDASGLPNPTVSMPGVILIGSERIEYLQKTGNVLTQLRRGTYGTGVKKIHLADARVQDFSSAQTIPYNDQTTSSELLTTNSATTVVSDLKFVPTKGTAVDPTGVASWFSVRGHNFVGDYNSTVGYRLNDVVVFNNKYYRNIVAARNIDPANSSYWTVFDTAIPPGYGQANDIEVFVAGRRLRKSPIKQWFADLGPSSLTGDVWLDAEFSVDGVTNSVHLTVAPPEGVQILVQKRTGKLWTVDGASLEDAETDQARFIRAATAYLPDTKYYVEAPVDPVILTESGETLETETGKPLELE